MIPQLLTKSNLLIQDCADLVHDALNTEAIVRLYTNNFSPTPGSVIGDFTEATFDGYSSWDTTGLWSEPAQSESGLWEFQTEIHTWEPPTMGDPEIVYGCYCFDTSGKYLFAGRFPTSVIFEVGGFPLLLRVIWQEWASITFSQQLGE